MFKLDLHTHSTESKDGGISATQYAHILREKLDFVAVTDHNSINLAMYLRDELGNKIIVGEEINTSEGEIIGLFLKALIKPGQPALATIKEIKDQGGLVYIPHPFENVRDGISEANLSSIMYSVDIIEARNGRAFFQNRGPKATTWARINGKVTAASSDAHGYKGLGTSYTIIKQEPTAQNLVELLSTAKLITSRPPLKTLLYPKANLLAKRFNKK